MSVIVDTCPLCSSRESTLIDRRVVQAELVTNQVCKTCGLVFQSPRMSDDEMAIFYQKAYRELYQGSEGPNKKDLEVQHGRAASLANFMEGRIASQVRHLDIGSSAGVLLLSFQERFRTTPVGVEPGRAYREYAQSKGLVVYGSLDELQVSLEAPFQLISLAHVLEHIPDPVGYLTKLRNDLLREDGLLLVEVPNLYAHDSFEIAHMLAFSLHTLTETLRKAGFSVIQSRRHGQPRSHLLPLYVTVLAKPEPAFSTAHNHQPRPETNVALKRRFGIFRRRVLQKLFPHQAWLPVPEA